MKVKEFLQDYISFILFYFVLMITISLIVSLDNFVKVSVVNIIYLNTLGIFFLMFFLFWEYFKKKKNLDTICAILDKQKENIAALLPEAVSYEQNLYFRLLHKLDNEYHSKSDKFYQDKKDFSDFINYWVHEIKTPIAASKLLLKNTSKSKDEILDIVENEIMSIENYVEQALYYSRADNFSQDYFISEINVSEAINHIIKKSAKLFIAKRIRIELDGLNFSIRSDIKWLSFIIEQVLLNALKYTGNNGRIKIYGFADAKEKCIIIEDNGIGIKPEDIGRIFEKGFTGYNGRENMKATGIGLYLSKKLANNLGHEISIESVYSEYTKVIIHFPTLIDYLRTAQ